jgi:uncharacterized protein
MPVNSPGPVPGSTVLPAGFPHPHASEEARSIAEKGMILRVQVGSGVHGTSITGQDDRDEMGLCLEPPQFVTGLASVPNGSGGLAPSVRFEQYERHTAWDRPGGLANRSGAGDLDVIIYSARKWARLAANAHRFVSRLAASRYLGYLKGQKAAMTGQPGAHTNRRNWWPSTGMTPSTPCMPCGSGYRASSCSAPGASRRRWVDDWLHRSYLNFWTRNQ